MKPGIHPEYVEITVSCSCGETFKTRSTKKGDLHARRQAISTLQHPDKGVIYKLFEEIAPRYTERPGGYTRILKLGPRSSDATEMVYLELV